MTRPREFDRQLAFKISSEQDAFLREMASRLGVSQGWVAREAIRRFMLEITTFSDSTDITQIVPSASGEAAD